MKPRKMAMAIWDKRASGNPRSPRPLREVAAEVGVSAATFSRIERGGTPDLPTYFKFCRWLDAPLDLFIGDYWPEGVKP